MVHAASPALREHLAGGRSVLPASTTDALPSPGTTSLATTQRTNTLQTHDGAPVCAHAAELGAVCRSLQPYICNCMR